VWHYI